MLKAMKLHKDAILPQKAHDGDAGFDLFALEDVRVDLNQTVVVPTGVAVDIPYGCYGDITGKSGLTSKTQLRVQRGIIDHGYQGEVGIMVTNAPSQNIIEEFSCRLWEVYGDNVVQISGSLAESIDNIKESNVLEIKKGQKVAQMIVVPCEPRDGVIEIKSFSTDTERSTGGFGSTGLKHMPIDAPKSVIDKVDEYKQLEANGFIGG